MGPHIVRRRTADAGDRPRADARPKMLLLDEPSMGLSPMMVQEMARIIREIVERGVPVVLVEQNAELALRLARYAYVLETGKSH